MKQIITLSDCLKCKECCHFYEGYEHLTPIVEENEKHFRIQCNEKIGKYHICPNFKKELCIIQDNKPFDCKIYPFNIMKDKNGNIVLAYDKTCRGIKNKTKKEIEEYSDYLIDFIKKNKILEKEIYIEPFQKELAVIKKIE